MIFLIFYMHLIAECRRFPFSFNCHYYYKRIFKSKELHIHTLKRSSNKKLRNKKIPISTLSFSEIRILFKGKDMTKFVLRVCRHKKLKNF